MSRYRVCFYNDLCDSTGHDHHVCQKEIIVAGVENEDAAIAQAKKAFEKHEQIADWSLHARSIDCECISQEAD
ncbi:hypothetical protein [Novosphingobium sp. M1R2S20]|uniref:Small metal-binding protein n=1 Tax=Novosphingobium rhizovicinum TaxID=3228928 RepID=A0ABV3RH77_9SPHN